MKKASALLGTPAFAGFYQSCASGHLDGGGGIIFSLVLLVLSGILATIGDHNEQIYRDTDAKGIVERVIAGEKPLFYLYLRPFSITNRAVVKNPQVQPIQDSLRPDRKMDLEKVLTVRLEKWAIPLEALGRPGEAIGAGRYPTSDKEWFDIFVMLAEAADGIILVPSDHEGALKEARWLIRNELMEKVIIIVPPASKAALNEGALKGLLAAGIVLPHKYPMGVIFKVNRDLQLVTGLPFETIWNEMAGGVLQDLKLKKTG